MLARWTLGTEAEDTMLRSEEELVGPNKQPDWTTQRRFARSRVYVLAPGQIEGEAWYRGKYDGGDIPYDPWKYRESLYWRQSECCRFYCGK